MPSSPGWVKHTVVSGACVLVRIGHGCSVVVQVTRDESLLGVSIATHLLPIMLARSVIVKLHAECKAATNKIQKMRWGDEGAMGWIDEARWRCLSTQAENNKLHRRRSTRLY